jgi:hypothetical protein
VVGLAAAGLLLSGCGSSLGIHPGSAIVVGTETVSMGKVDRTTTSFCKAYLAQPASSGQSPQALPMGLLRSYAATSLAKRALGEQLADQYDVQPATGYQQALSQYQQSLADSPADQRDAAILVAGADAYLQNVQVAVGQQLSGNSGSSNADIKAALQRGQVATQDWLKDHDAFVDPVFGIKVDGGQFTPTTDQTSYALSALASQGTKVSLSSQSGPPASYTAQLPAAQVCR